MCWKINVFIVRILFHIRKTYCQDFWIYIFTRGTDSVNHSQVSWALNHTIKCKLINPLQMQIPVKVPEEWRKHLAPCIMCFLFVCYWVLCTSACSIQIALTQIIKLFVLFIASDHNNNNNNNVDQIKPHRFYVVKILASSILCYHSELLFRLPLQ